MISLFYLLHRTATTNQNISIDAICGIVAKFSPITSSAGLSLLYYHYIPHCSECGWSRFTSIRIFVGIIRTSCTKEGWVELTSACFFNPVNSTTLYRVVLSDADPCGPRYPTRIDWVAMQIFSLVVGQDGLVVSLVFGCWCKYWLSFHTCRWGSCYWSALGCYFISTRGSGSILVGFSQNLTLKFTTLVRSLNCSASPAEH